VISNRLNRDFEPIEPRTARDLSLDHEELDCSEAPVSNHRYRPKPFIEWCAEAEVDTRNDISGLTCRPIDAVAGRPAISSP
jgi:hypothetical protein